MAGEPSFPSTAPTANWYTLRENHVSDRTSAAKRFNTTNFTNAAVEEMLIQHLLTERIFRTVFDNPDFTRFAKDFWGFAEAGARLANLHVNYESQPEYDKLKFVQTPDTPLDWRVEKMKLSRDKTLLIYNDFLTLAGIPPQVFDYRLGTRSALEWVVDQYRVKIDKRSGIVNDPNRVDDPQYIVQLIGKVITVSLETVDIVDSLPVLEIR